MKKSIITLSTLATLFLGGCTLFPQKETPTLDGSATNSGVVATPSYRFTYDEETEAHFADINELNVRVIFDYQDYAATCVSTSGTTCTSSEIMPPEHYTEQPIMISGNTLYNTFEIGTKDPSVDITKIIAERFNFSLSRCPLTRTGSSDWGRLIADDTTIYTLNYDRFRGSNGTVDPAAVERICGGFMGYEVYYSPIFPDRYVIEQAGYEKRTDALFDFLYIDYLQ